MSAPSIIAQKLGPADPTPPEATAYVEEENDAIFLSLSILHERGLGSRTLEELKYTLIGMYEGFAKMVDWSD